MRGSTVPSQLPRTSRSNNDLGSFANNAWSQTSREGVVGRINEEEGRDVLRQTRRRAVGHRASTPSLRNERLSESDAASSPDICRRWASGNAALSQIAAEAPQMNA